MWIITRKSYLPWLVIISHRRSFNRRKMLQRMKKRFICLQRMVFSSPLKVGGILRNTFIRRRTHSMESLLLTDWVCRLPIRNFHGLKAMLLFLRVLMETSLTAKHPCFFPSWRKRRDTRFLSTWRLMILREKISRLISAKKVSVCQMGRLCKQYIILSKPIFLWNIPRNGSNLENHVRFQHRNKLLW